MSKGDYIQTFTGRKVYPFDPNPADLCIEDIAHALALQCRFTGHVREPYSVAQHSIHVASMSDRPDMLWGLLHDASEAYLTDVASPVKQHEAFLAYRDAEAKIMHAVCDRFDLPYNMPLSVHIADRVALESEAASLLSTVEGWEFRWPERRVTVTPLDWRRVEHQFTLMFKLLGGK